MAITYGQSPFSLAGQPGDLSSATLLEAFSRLGLRPGQRVNRPGIGNMAQMGNIVNDINPNNPYKKWGSGYSRLGGSNSTTGPATLKDGTLVGTDPMAVNLSAIRNRNKRPAFSAYGMSPMKSFGGFSR